MRSIRNVNVAVVGGAGFLGSHLVNHLIEDRGCHVLVIDNLVAGRREFVHPKARFEHHDITGSEERLFDLFLDHVSSLSVSGGRYRGAPLYVFNYAAYPYIPVSFARPIHVADVNYMGAMKVINAAHEAAVEGILQVSSAEIYGDCGILGQRDGVEYYRKIDEHARVNPHSSYGVAKAAVDCAVQVRLREAKTPCIALRQFNAVGERDVVHPYVIPEIYRQLKKQMYAPLDESSKAVVRLGNNSFRDFMYARDAVEIAVELLEKGEWGQVYNSGSETGIKMYDLARLMGKLMGFGHVEVERDESRVRPWEIWHLLADCSKLKAVIGPRTATSLEESLRRTIKSFDEQKEWVW